MTRATAGWSNAAPLLAFVAAVGSCAQPYLDRTRPPSEPEGKLPTLAKARLNPSFTPPVRRDPFAYLGRPGDPTILADSSASTPKDAAPVAAEPASESRPANPPTVTVPEPVVETVDYVLGATLVRGPKRSAIIDGRVYGEGDRLRARAGSPSPPAWELARIDRESVTLRDPARGRSVRLQFAKATPGAVPDRPNVISTPRPDRGVDAMLGGLLGDAAPSSPWAGLLLRSARHLGAWKLPDTSGPGER